MVAAGHLAGDAAGGTGTVHVSRPGGGSCPCGASSVVRAGHREPALSRRDAAVAGFECSGSAGSGGRFAAVELVGKSKVQSPKSVVGFQLSDVGCAGTTSL